MCVALWFYDERGIHAVCPAPAAPPPAPDAKVIDISASLTVAGHKFYDQYADTKLRAVGDLLPFNGES